MFFFNLIFIFDFGSLLLVYFDAESLIYLLISISWMKKRGVVFFLLVLIIVIFINGCADSYPGEAQLKDNETTENIPKAPEIANQPVQVLQPAEDIGVVTDVKGDIKGEEIKTEAGVKQAAGEETKFKIFQPRLTYPGAYNGPLYGTSEQVGAVSMDVYFEKLDRNGINFFIGMFPIFGNPKAGELMSDKGLGNVIDAAQKHPGRIIPFFNPGIGGEDVEKLVGATLTGWYSGTLSSSQAVAGKDFIKGFGEVETQEWGIRHNDARVLELVDIARKNKIAFMFHPVADKIEDVKEIIEAYPDTIFLIHMYREDLDNSKGELIKLLQEHNNLYYSIDAAHIIHVNGMDIIYDYDSRNKQSSINKFVAMYDNKEQSFINDAIKTYKPLVDAAPDKVVWGTEIGPEYAMNAEVFDRAVKASRLVIAGFAPEHQEGVGYKNALRAFGEGVIVDSNVKVIDTRAWGECSEEQIDGCDEECGDDEMTPESDDCLVGCVIKLKCREVPEMDVG